MSSNPRVPLLPGYDNAYLGVTAYQPVGTAAMDRFYATAWTQGVADPTIKELMRLRNARTTGCKACQSMRFGPAIEAGFDESQGDLAVDGYESSEQATDRQKAALRWTDRIIGNDGPPDETQLADMQRHFGAAELVEMTLSVAFNVGFSKFQIVLGTETPEVATNPWVLELQAPDAAEHAHV